MLLFLAYLGKLPVAAALRPRAAWCLCRGNSSRDWAVFPALASRRPQDRAVMGMGGRSLKHGSATLSVP